ncbi:MAG: YodL domain-containing protein, partial [Ruminococcus sp.]|nr:YodL domain-containing protein [Ruminococcus sp.]
MQNANSDTSLGVTTISIPQLYDIVKTNDPLFYENSSAIGRADREAEIQAQTDYRSAVEKYNEYVLTADSEEIAIDGREGTWYVIDTQTIGGKELFLLESENYGDEAACLIVDGNRNVLMDEVYNGFEDYIEANIVPEGQMIISGEVASEMWYYGFDVYVNGEKLDKYDDVSDKNGTFGRLEDKENTISAAVNDVTLYHTADTIATAVFDISKKYFNAEKSISVPYYLNLEKYHEDNDWEDWRNDENEYANTMWSLLDRNYSNAENYFLNVIEASRENNKMAEDREAALKAMQTIDVFKAGMEEYRPANNKVTVLPVEEKSYTEQLYTRVNDEYSHFIGQMKKESPDMLVRSAAEIADKEKITQYILEGTASLSDEQYEALLSRENPLDEIYEQWVQNGELSSFEDVGIALEETANRILISLDRENSRSEEKVNAVLAVSQNDTNRYYVANNVSVDDVRKTITSSDKLFIDLCALGEKQITEAQFAEYSQRNGVAAVDVDIDEQTMHVYGSEKPIVSFEEIKADFDEIAKVLDLKNNTITFSVVTIEGEKPIVIGSYIDEDDITALEEYQDYIYDTGRKNIDVTVDYYTIGMGDNESYGADTDEKDYISEHLDEVLKSKYTDRLESETYFIATPAELLEEISEETEKNYLFTVAEFEDGSRYVIPGEVGDDNIKDTAAWQDVKLNNFDIDNVSDLDEDIRVTYTVYQTGIGEAVIPTAEEAEKIEASLDEILSDAVVVDTDNSSVRPWDDVDDVISRMEEVWEERHEKEKNVSDGFDNSNFLYPNNLMKITHDIEGKDRYNFDDAILQIKLAGSEWLRPVDAVIEMNRRGVDINDIEMLNVRYVSSDGTVGEKDVTPEQYMVYLAHSEERTNAFLAAVNAAEERKKIPENIMKIIRDDMPSFVKSAVAWDELMEYDSISEKFDKGEDPVAVVKPYLASNGTFSWNADELKDGYFDWTVKDNGDTAVIFVSVNDSDTFREMYNSHFEVPWTEIADAFKQRIEQEKNYNKISDGTITVTAVGEDKFRFSDRSSNTEAIESREQLVERFAKMFNKAELESIINSVIGNAEYEEQSEPEKETPVEKSNSSTLIVNIYGGPGAGKSTTALQLAAELKKRGYHAEYIPEVAKDYVYAKNFDMLDGSLEHQKQIFAEQKQRVDLMIGNVDVAITDAPLTLNTIYMAPDEITPEYAAHILDEYNSYNNYNIYIDRDLSVEFEQEGRIHNLSESIEKDGEIKSMLISNDIAFDEFDRNNITGIADRVSSSLEHLKKIEQTKSKMKEMGIPYSDKPFNSTEKEDIYAYDGSMSLEDFRKRQLLNSESVDENANSPVGNLGGDEDKQIIDLSKLSKITLNDEYERGTDQPDDFRYIKNTITFSDLNSSFLIRRNKEFTYDYDVLPDLDEGDTFITRQGMLKEVQDFLEAAKSDSDKSISITDMNGNTTVLKGSQYVFEATEDRLAFVIPDAGYVEISERDDGSSDYVFYDNDFNTTDRGMYNDMDVTLRQALTFILKDAGYDIDKCKQMDFEELRSRAEEKTEKEKTIEASKYYIDNLLDVNVESMYYDPETETIHWYALDPNGDNGNGVFNEYVIDKDFAKEAIEQHIPDEIIGYVDGNCPNLTTAAISSQEFVKMADEHIRISEIAESESNDNYITIDYSSGDDVNKIVADFVKNKFELDIAQSRNSPVGNLYGDEEKQLEKAYEIYQRPAGERYHDIRFTSYDQLEKMGQLPDRFNYEMVYSGRLDDIDDNNKLEGIFIKFNIDRPKDFTGHSLSTSDVIVIEDEKGKSAYFVDDNG